ncbi:MAG TPA: hypothetical protein VK140_16550 [Ktedonobacteraceae bacterium]|nr:hypothetical protein [Ktedonobacteraceae bacterium]
MTTMTNHTTYDNEQLPVVEPATETTVNACTQGHAWQPTIIIGYFHCVRCNALAACRICVSKMRGKPLVGVCQQHQHLCAPVIKQEVLA